MEKNISKFTGQIYIALLGAIILFSYSSFGQISDKSILDKHIDWSILNPNIYQVCAILAAKGIPIGVEDISDFNNLKYNKVIQIDSGTLREILNSLIKQNPDFMWEVHDGVVNIYPVRSRDEILKTFLDTKLQSFSSKKEGGRKQIANKLYSSDAIKMFFDSRQLNLSIITRAELKVADTTKDINISDIDLKGLLNKIVKESNDSKRWLIQRTKDGGVLLVF